MKYFKKIAILFVSGVVVLLNGHSLVFAQASNSAQGLQVSPTRIEINQINPGESRSFNVGVMNVTASDLTYESLVSDFTSSNETGSPKLMVDESLPESVSIKSWIKGLPDEFSLKARETKEFNLQINVPEDAEFGGHYGAVLFPGVEPDVDSTGVGLSASTGVLILVSVGDSSDIIEDAELEGFYSAIGEDQNWFFENSPIDFIVRIKNTGNVHVKPVGSIEISNMFGNVIKEVDINSQNSNVLPDSVRKFNTQIDRSWMFGRYTANLALGYGTKGQAITGTIYFWVIPYKLILVAILVLATLVFILKRLIKSYNRRIIEKSRHEENKKTNSKKN